jgi:hypothetical protein
MKTPFVLSILFVTASCSGQFGGKADEYFAKAQPIEKPTEVKVIVEPNKPVDPEVEKPSLSLTTELFKQTDRKKVDIVWIIDNSGSMSDEQAALGSNFNAFIQDFVDTEVDFKMAITTTDAREAHKGLMVPQSDIKLNSAAAQNNPNQFISDFNTLVKVGTSGSGSERGLEASEGFISRYGDTFFRPDAYMVFVILSDEQDQSVKSPAEYTAMLKATKSNPGLVKVYSIVDTELSNSGSGITVGFDRYAAVSDATAGQVANIRSDFHETLSGMSATIMSLLDSFALSNTPVASTLKVYVNNVAMKDFTYDAKSRSIKFNPNAIPPVGANIKVTYEKVELVLAQTN